MQEAISATRGLSDTTSIVCVGLTGLPIAPAKVTAAVFLRCWNVAIAAPQIISLVSRRLGGVVESRGYAGRHRAWTQPISIDRGE